MSSFEDVRQQYYELLTQEEFTKHLDNTEMYVILVDGQRIRTRSGKSEWRSKGAAKNALRDHLSNIKYGIKRDVINVIDETGQGSYVLTMKAIREAEDEWINDHVIFLPLRLYHPPVKEKK